MTSLYDLYDNETASHLYKLDSEYGDQFAELLAQEYRTKIQSWDWDDIIVPDAKTNAELLDDQMIGSVYLGKVYDLYPSQQYYTLWTGNPDPLDILRDDIYAEVLDSIAESFGGWIEDSEGDPTDVMFCLIVDNAEPFDRVDHIPPSYTLITDSHEIAEILDYVGYDGDSDDYGCLFVLVGE